MFSYQCDCCDKIKKADDRESNGWWVVATGYYRSVGEKTQFQIWEFPTGSKLGEPHEGLFHVCSSAHLLELMKRLLKEKYQQDRKKEKAQSG